MNILEKSVSCTIAAVGMQLLLTVQLLAIPTSPDLAALRGMQVRESNPINPVYHEQGDSPDMTGREGVPPSAGSGSR